MFHLNPAPSARIKDTRAEQFDDYSAETLDKLRDALVTYTKNKRIDISDRFSDQFYAVFPWTLHDDEKAPKVRRVTESLVLDLAGAAYGVSPGAFTITTD